MVENGKNEKKWNFLDIDSIKNITNHDISYYVQKGLFSDEQIKQKNFINHMINNDIPFCALVSGFRGTGKSVFVDYIFDEYTNDREGRWENDNVIVVKFNATKYVSYEYFLRKIIRELYLAANKKRNKVQNIDDLRCLYVRTFNEVTESSSEKESTAINKEIIASLSLKTSADISTKINIVLNLILAGLIYFSNITIKYLDKALSLKIPLIILIAINVIIGVNTEYKRKKSYEKKKSMNIKSLYDGEIAEYKLFNELKKINDEGKKVVFIIDELDKLGDDEVEQIVRELKPLLLYIYCDSVLVAGINFEDKIIQESTAMDSVASSLFNYRIYVPLGFLADYEKISSLVSGQPVFFELDDNTRDLYFKMKAMHSRGVKRAFISNIMSDGTWEKSDLIVDTEKADSLYQKDGIVDYYEDLLRLEEHLAELYSDQEYLIRDLSLQYGNYVISFLANKGYIKTNDYIAYIRTRVDYGIPESSMKYIKKMLSKGERESIIKIILDEDGGVGYENIPDFPSPAPNPDNVSGQSLAVQVDEQCDRDDSTGQAHAVQVDEQCDTDDSQGQAHDAQVVELSDTSNSALKKVNITLPENYRKIEIGRFLADSLSNRKDQYGTIFDGNIKYRYREDGNKEFLDMILSQLHRCGVTVNSRQWGFLDDVVRVFYYFASYMNCAMDEVADLILEALDKSGRLETGYRNISQSSMINLLCYVFNGDNSRLKVTNYVKMLMIMLYFKDDAYTELRKFLDKEWNRIIGPFDIVDDLHPAIGMQIRYYKSISYLKQYDPNRRVALNETMCKTALELKLERIAMVVFSISYISQEQWDSYENTTDKLHSKMLLVNLCSYEEFKKDIDNLLGYFKEK